MIWVLVVYYSRDTRRETNNIYAIHFVFGMLRLTSHAKSWTNGIKADLSRDGIDV